MTKQIYFILIACLLGSCSSNTTYENKTEKESSIPPIVWAGAGFYYGMWFESEDDYNDWCRHNYEDYRKNHAPNSKENYHRDQKPGDRRDRSDDYGGRPGQGNGAGSQGRGGGYGGGHGGR